MSEKQPDFSFLYREPEDKNAVSELPAEEVERDSQLEYPQVLAGQSGKKILSQDGERNPLPAKIGTELAGRINPSAEDMAEISSNGEFVPFTADMEERMAELHSRTEALFERRRKDAEEGREEWKDYLGKDDAWIKALPLPQRRFIRNHPRPPVGYKPQGYSKMSNENEGIWRVFQQMAALNQHQKGVLKGIPVTPKNLEIEKKAQEAFMKDDDSGQEVSSAF